jgi:phosphoesterase RecJ-like protein
MNSDMKARAAEILSAIQKSKNILLHLHPRPDGDSVGSALAMYHMLKGMDKKATVIKGDSPLPYYLSCLPGFENIIEKNFFEINLSQFDLFIAQDVSSLGMISALAEISFPSTLKVVRIDHHQTERDFASINFVDPTCPATCELLFTLFKGWDIELTHDVALCLFIGIYSDTGGFKYPNVKRNTFLAAAELADKAPDFSDAIAFTENSNSFENIAYEGLALSSVEKIFGGTVLVSSVSNEQLLKLNIPKEETVLGGLLHIPNQLRSVIGCKIGISLVEEELGIVKVSMRTSDGEKFNLSKIAEALGGGGHKAAAGITIKGSLNETKEKVLQAVSHFYGNTLASS